MYFRHLEDAIAPSAPPCLRLWAEVIMIMITLVVVTFIIDLLR